jgi:hypothetical protein
MEQIEPVGRNYQTLIFHFRDMKVMLDSDLAVLYGMPTKALKQQVKRNLQRFPADFMFVLTATEFDSLRSQIVTTNRGGGRSVLAQADRLLEPEKRRGENRARGF